MDTSNLDLCEFLSICIEITSHAAAIVKDFYDNGKQNVKYKAGPHDPVTDADYKIQTLAIKALRHNWSDIQIVGEESHDFEGPLGIDHTKFRKDLVNSSLFANLESTSLPLKDLVVWIDPVDGTSDYVKGNLYGVTTLIGASINGKAAIGIIGKYYDMIEKEKFAFNPRTYFGYIKCPQIYIVKHKNGIEDVIEELKILKPENEDRLYIASSKILNSTKKLYEELKADKIDHLSGLGNKIVECLIGNYDAYCYPQMHACRWDICGGDALIRAIGGQLTDLLGNEYSYIIGEDYECSKGVLVCTRENTFKKFVQASQKVFADRF